MGYTYRMKRRASGIVPRIFFDITDGVVSAGVGISGDEGAELLWSKSVPYLAVRAQPAADECKRLCAALLEISSEAAREGVIALSHHDVDFRRGEIVCALSTPWSFSNSVLVSSDLKERKDVEHGFLDTLRADAYKSLLMSNQYHVWTSKYGNSTIMQQCDQEVLLEGYHVPHLRNHQARNVAVRTHLMLAASECVEKIRGILADTFPHQRLVFHTPTYLFVKAGMVRPLDLTGRATLIEVGSKHTSISMVHASSILGVDVVRGGTFDLIHSIAPGSGSYTEAYTRAVSAIKGDAPLSGGVAKIISEWRTDVFERISEIVDGIVPPMHVVVAAEIPFLQQYISAVSSEPVWRTTQGDPRMVHAFPLSGEQPKGVSSNTNTAPKADRMSQLFTAVDNSARQR